ncbi:MAG: lipo-like protein [Deltaproteobacteria bacterium]|nr:lipo-like protein [Deltaproteobacteria bacterium]
MTSRLRRHLVRLATGLLTKPLGRYQRRTPNDLASLRRHIKKGDVILVEGDQRVSEVIKYLTQSSWSHSALYVGDELWRRNPAARSALRAQFGDDAQHLIVEAIVEEGVVASGLAKYIDFNMRVCRPYNLRREDLHTVLDEVIGQIGCRYDVRNLVDLMRYFLPVSLVPRALRRNALEFGSGIPTQVICSTLLARAFDRVRYPILPQVTPIDEPEQPRGLIDWVRGRPLQPYGLFQMAPITLTTPRDFDISPYFEVIKFNIIADMQFDYRRIRWVEESQAS